MKILIAAMVGLLLAPHLAMAQAREDQAMPAENASLFVQASNPPKNQVFFQGGHSFFDTLVDAQLSFTMGSDGRATSVVLHPNGQNIPGARQP